MKINEINDIDRDGDGGINGHSFDDARQLMMSKFRFLREYQLSRPEPGFNIAPDVTKHWEKNLRKAESQMTNLQSALRYLKMTMINDYCGHEDITASLSYTWYTLLSGPDNTGVLYYQDGGMGSDYITLGATTKEALEMMRQVFVDSGLLRSSEDLKMARDVNTKKRLEVISQWGIHVGQTVQRNFPSITSKGAAYDLKFNKNYMTMRNKGPAQFKIIEIKKNGMLVIQMVNAGGWEEYKKTPVGTKFTVKPRFFSRKDYVA